jgi:4-amino-4-deoxy-L-arabinose transferase-like glycosyltransferase
VYEFYLKSEDRLNEFYHKYKDHDWLFILPIMLLALTRTLEHFFWLLSSGRGFPQAADSKWYLDYATGLLKDFNVGLHMNDIMYFGYNMLLTLLLALFEDPVAVLFIQSVISGLSVILVYKIALILFNRSTAILAALFYATRWEITLWSMYILSDSFFISVLLLCVYFLLMAFESDKKSYKILFAVTAIYMMVFRPTGIMTMAVILAYIAIRLGKKRIAVGLNQYRRPIAGALLSIFAIGIYLYSSHKFDPLLQSLQVNVKMVLYNVYAKGWLYDMATPYDHFFRPDYRVNWYGSLFISFVVNNWDHVSILYVKRAIGFLGKWVWEIDLSSLTGIGQFLYNVAPTALFTVGSIAALRDKKFRKASIVWLLIFAVFAFCLILFIDWMYRYRYPAVPFIAIAAAFGADQILRWTLIRVKKIAGLLQYANRKNTGCHTGF